MKILYLIYFFSLPAYLACSQIPYSGEKIKKITFVSYTGSSSGFQIHEIPYYLRGNLFIADSFKISNAYYFQTREEQKADYKTHRKTDKYRYVRGVFIKDRHNTNHKVSELKRFNDTLSYATVDTMLKKMNHPKDFILREAGITDVDIADFVARKKRTSGAYAILFDTTKIMFNKDMVLPLEFIIACKCLGSMSSHGPRSDMWISFTPESHNGDYVLSTSACTFPYKYLTVLLPILHKHLPGEFRNKNYYLSKRRVLDLALGYLRKNHEKDGYWIHE
jgi:hypothetical protein